MMLNKVSLNTIGLNRIGLNRIGKPSRASSDRPYIDPEVLASLNAVCICYGKSNDDPDRAVVKNLVDPDNPFVISNAAYTEGSGYADKGSPYYGAFVTDGVEDLITSTKTVQEMGITDEVTVVSMIHQIDKPSNFITTNNIRTSGSVVGRNAISEIGKTGIYGWYKDNIQGSTINVINNILGDKADYAASASSNTNLSSKFSVVGYISNDSINETSSVAWYWTIIANKVLTTDQINQVIAYFNLDRTLKPDILCNTIKQGITNENHAEFGDKLIDFSDNGRDIQLNNIAWKGDSGIGKYATDFTSWLNKPTETSHSKSILEAGNVLRTKSATSSMKVKVQFDKEAIGLSFRYFEGGVSKFIYINSNGEYSLPPLEEVGVNEWEGFSNNSSSSVTITQIPSHAGALCLDGINDFGKVTGMPVYKDYTIIADYERFYLEPITGGRASILSKSSKVGDGSFIFNLEDQNGGKACYTFGEANGNISDDITRIIRYQSKYYNTKALSIGTAEDNDFMILGKVREVDNRYFYGAIYSLMSFPYSMSEFLIERQLKKHKLGTLYPDMVEFRPIIKSNASYYNIVFYYKNEKVENGTYLTVGSSIGMHIRLSSSPVNEIKSITVNGIPATFKYHDANNNIYQYDFNLTSKSPQNINITIDEYIRYEDIVQPYPVLLRFNNENGNEVSWGGKFRVGSTITRIGSAADSNLLPNIYNIFGLLLNGNQITSSKVIVEKTMVFKAKSAYIFDNNEPKCILSPSRLRIPNSSYKLLGYIPDISGHGNNGKINNSAYEGMSGVNGDPVVLDNGKTYQNKSNYANIIGDNKNILSITDIVFNRAMLYSFVKYKGLLDNTWNKDYPSYKIKITGMKDSFNLQYNYLDSPTATGTSKFYIENDGVYTIPKSYKNNDTLNENDVWIGFSFNGSAPGQVNLTIEILPDYEGAYCLDGVDDFVTIPTLSSGGKQMLMKVNWNSLNHVLYDQRNNAEAPFCIVTASGTIAYNQRNVGGNTYIDGILNNHILVDDLQAITHNIVLNNDYNVANSKSFIGTNYTKSIYAKMLLYDFMLFDEISTDDKIKELNEYVGIEGDVWGILTQLSNSTLISNETLIKNE